MAEASELKWRVTEIATCPICLEDCKNAKLLPCVHSFCLGCLQTHCKENVSGGNVACPVCRKEFQPPDTGVEALPHNFFLQNLIDARDASSPKTEEVLCEICVASEKEEDEDKGEIPSATMYCADCNLKLCKRCSRSCRVKPRGEPHHVRPLGVELSAELIQQRGSYCDQHKDDRLKLYCHDCEITVCLMCFVVNHNGHKCADVEKAAGEFIQQFDSTIESVSSRIDGFHVAMAQVDTEVTQFLSAMDQSGTSIQQRWEAVNQITEKHANRLLQEVQTAKSDGLKEASNRSEELKLAVTSLESFKVYLAELKTKGSPCDVASAVKAMRSRAGELLETCVIPSDYHAPCVSFAPINIDELTNEEQNLIGRFGLQTDRNSGIIAVYLFYSHYVAISSFIHVNVSGHVAYNRVLNVCFVNVTF